MPWTSLTATDSFSMGFFFVEALRKRDVSLNTKYKACLLFNTAKLTCPHPGHHDGFVHIRATCRDLLVQGGLDQSVDTETHFVEKDLKRCDSSKEKIGQYILENEKMRDEDMTDPLTCFKDTTFSSGLGFSESSRLTGGDASPYM